MANVSESDVERLVADGLVRRCEPDEASARSELAAARAHLESAALLAVSDPNGSFQLAYDAARKAITAHMRFHGLRVGSGAGAHAKTGRYAQAALADPRLKPHIDAFDDMRSLRNQSEYDALLLDERDADDALRHARAVVEAVHQALS